MQNFVREFLCKHPLDFLRISGEIAEEYWRQSYKNSKNILLNRLSKPGPENPAPGYVQ